MHNIIQVNINDIEDLITAKIQIDKDNPNITNRSDLNEFVDNYCKLDYILANNDNIIIPFKIIELFGKKYLFHATDSNDEFELLKNKLESVNYDLSKLKKISANDLLLQLSDEIKYYIINNNNYYLL